MASRTDQLHSYQFTAQRVVSALVTGQTDPARSPLSRLAGSALIGALVAALSLAAVAVYGILVPGGGTGWRDPSAVIVEKETGARYVYLDGALRPVPNYTSALLVIGSAQAHTVSVARRSIARVPRGAPLGIPGAPDSLPEAGRLLPAPWTVCADATGASSVSIGSPVPGGRSLGDTGVLVRAAGDPAGPISLVWHGHRHRVSDFALGALAWRGQPVLTAAAALLAAVPAGSDLGAVPISGRGRRSRAGFTVGQVFVVRPQGGAPQYAVAVADGLAPISQVQANLLLGDRQTERVQGRSGAIELSGGDYTAAPAAAPLTPRAGELAPPLSMPALAQPSNADSWLCVRVDGPRGLPSIRMDVPADPAAGTAPGTGTGGNGALAGRVVVAPDRGTIVEAMPSPDAQSGALSLVSDLGVRYPVPSADVLDILGYAGVRPVRMPSSLVVVLPTGPVLDPDAARAVAH